MSWCVRYKLCFLTDVSVTGCVLCLVCQVQVVLCVLVCQVQIVFSD